MSIPIGASYTSTASGSIVKPVQCVRCGGEYVYIMERKVTGGGFSFLYVDNDGAARRAAAAARQNLQTRLKDDCDLVACPDCGHYQPQMIRKIRGRRFLVIFIVWILACLGVWIAYLTSSGPSQIEEIVEGHTLGVIVTAVLLLAIGSTPVFLFDPNRTASNRIVRERNEKCRAIRKADFEAMVAQQEAADREERRLLNAVPKW